MEKGLTADQRLAAFFSSVLPTNRKVDSKEYDNIERVINVNDITGIVEVCVRRKEGTAMRVGYGSTVAEATQNAVYRLLEIEKGWEGNGRVKI